MSKLNVAFLLGNLTVGGSETKFVRLAGRLAESGHRIHLIALGKPHTLQYEVSEKVSLICLDRRTKFSAGNFFKIFRYIRTQGIDKIVCVNPYPLVYGWPVSRLGNRKRAACIASINTSELQSRRDSLFMMIYGFILRRCDTVIFGAERQANDWRNKYRIAEDRTTVLHNGVDIEHFQDYHADVSIVRQSLSVPKRSQIIGCVAQLRPEKAHRLLLEAVTNLVDSGQDVSLLLVGDGPEKERIQTWAKELGLSDRVYFAGQVKDVRPYLLAMDVFVLASIAVEVFSNAALEAMAMGVPVITSDIGGATEMIDHGRGGLVFPKGDADALTRHLKKVLRDPDLADCFRQEAWRRLESEFTIAKMDNRYVEILGAS